MTPFKKFHFGAARHQVYTSEASQNASRARAAKLASRTNKRRAAMKRAEEAARAKGV